LSSAFNLIAPLLFLFFGTHLLRMTVAEILIYRIPFAAGFYLLYSWLTGGTRSPFWTEFYETFLAPSICLTVLRSLIKPFGAPFRVTNKNIGRGEIAFNRQVAAPFVILMVAHLLGYAFSIGAGRLLEEPEAFGIATYYAVQNIIVLWMCLLVCVDVAQEHSFVRFPRKFPCLLTWDDTGVTGESVSVSEGDLVFTSARQDCALPATVFLHVPALGLQDVAARVQKAGSTITLEFRHLTLPQRRLLISELFCRPKIWERPARSEAKAAWEYLCSGLRMYPLAESP
jgi:cellulose synthase (UDP-forming)